MSLKTTALILTCAAALFGVAACGQKGALYLPDKGGQVVERPAGTATQTPQTGASQPAAAPSSKKDDSTEQSKNKPK